MKKLIYSLIVAVFCTTAIIAIVPITSGKTITLDVAQTVAVNFYKQNVGTQVNTASLAYTETSSSGDAVYFVFNIIPVGTPPSGMNTGGFVIIVADDAQYPVIGYSTEGSYVVPAPSSNAGYWMEQRKKEIIANRIQNVQPTAEISDQWTAYLNSQAVAPRAASTVTVSPLVKALWGQGSPYNALCPGVSKTGCVATAMAQIMRYWNYPVKGTGSSSYNCNYGVLTADYGNTIYDWSSVPTGKVDSANNAVATLMYQCGVSVDMNYSPSVSDAFVTIYDNPQAPQVCAQIAYTQYFGYNAETIQALQEYYYSDQNWINAIETELNASRPVEYVGFDAIKGGHTWVCDGYDSNNKLHMNWGWNGIDDGYYSINLLNPGGYNFSDNHEVLVGIKPMSVTGIASIPAAEIFQIYPNPAGNQLTIQTSSSRISGLATVSIINMLGQEALSYSLSLGEDGGEAIDISKLSAGMYFLQMKTEGAIVTQRFVKE